MHSFYSLFLTHHVAKTNGISLPPALYISTQLLSEGPCPAGGGGTGETALITTRGSEVKLDPLTLSQNKGETELKNMSS